MAYKMSEGKDYEDIDKASLKAFLGTFFGKRHDSLETLIKNLSPFTVRYEDVKLLVEGSIQEAAVYYREDRIVANITREDSGDVFYF